MSILELISRQILRKDAMGLNFDNKNQIINFFLKNSSSQWILHNPNILKSLEILMLSMDKNMQYFFNQIELAFIPCQGLWSSTIYSEKNLTIIIIFPNLLKIFDSAKYLTGAAILAHELGHIFHRHAKKNLSPIDQQIEADSFAVNLGFKRELIEFLSLYPNSFECKLRLNQITKEEAMPPSIL